MHIGGYVRQAVVTTAGAHGVRLRPGMTIAIEPMINAGDYEVSIDGWHVATEDGSKSAHYENTVLITAGEPEILSMRGMRDAE